MSWVSLPHVSLATASSRRKVDDMSIEQLARTSHLPLARRFDRSRHHPNVSYENQQKQLRDALAREEALRHQNDELIEQQQVLSELLASREAAADCVARLTPRQHQIMELVLAGHPSKIIAFKLGLSQRTVDNHRAAIMRKTGSKSLPALARVALAAAWNGAGEPFVQPLTRLALGAAWNGAEEPHVQRKSSVMTSHARSGWKLDTRA